jgi:hypothetical protein
MHRLYWKSRDLLVAWGLLTMPQFRMRRHHAGVTRSPRMEIGTRRRIRHVSLRRLLST